jgi:phosphate transport system permease protein
LTTLTLRLARRRGRILRERLIELVLFFAALVSVLTTVGIVYILVKESVTFFQHVPLGKFLTDTQWTPLFDDAHFGIVVLLSGTLTSSLVALCIAIPLGTIIAIYLSEFAPFRLREIAKPFLELLGGVPTIIYGYFALLFVTPLLQKIYPDLPGFNLLSAGIVMGIMIIPYVSSISEDAMRAVPMSLREGSYALGATRFQTAVKVVVPAAFSGIASAYILGISRAVGETMILAVAAGRDHHRLHRAGRARRPAAWLGRLPDHLRRRTHAAGLHAPVQHRRPCAAQDFQGKVLTSPSREESAGTPFSLCAGCWPC